MSALEAELRRAIVADPDSDELRLVYADYWEEAGEPLRAELIRLELELDEFFGRWALAPPGAMGRLEALRAAVRRPDPPGVSARYRRGLIHHITVSPAELVERAPALVTEHPIRSATLTFDRGGPELLDELAASPALGSIRSLAMHSPNPDVARTLLTARLAELSVEVSDLETIEAIAAAPLDGLRSLVIAAEEDPRDYLTPLTRSPNLGAVRSLTLEGFAFTDRGLRQLGDSSLGHGLEELVLRDGLELGGAALGELAGSPAMRGLRRLSLDAVPVDADTAGAIAGFAGVSELEVTAEDLVDDSLNNGVFDPRVTRPLTDLRVSFANLSGAAPLLAALEAPNLVRLTLYESELGDPELEALARASLPALAELRVGQNRATEIGAMALARSPLSSRVRRADLSRSAISDDVARALAAWSFTELVIRDNPLRYRGLRALIDGSALDSIAVLDLYNTRVTDASVSALLDPKRFPQLAELRLPNTVSPKLRARTRQRLRRYSS